MNNWFKIQQIDMNKCYQCGHSCENLKMIELDISDDSSSEIIEAPVCVQCLKLAEDAIF